MNLHLVARAVLDRPQVPPALRFAAEHGGVTGERKAYFGERLGWLTTRVCERSALGESPAPGPIIVQEFDATILVPPEFSATLDRDSNIVMAQS